jgi:hypothetical protein
MANADQYEADSEYHDGTDKSSEAEIDELLDEKARGEEKQNASPAVVTA